MCLIDDIVGLIYLGVDGGFHLVRSVDHLSDLLASRFQIADLLVQFLEAEEAGNLVSGVGHDEDSQQIQCPDEENKRNHFDDEFHTGLFKEVFYGVAFLQILSEGENVGVLDGIETLERLRILDLVLEMTEHLRGSVLIDESDLSLHHSLRTAIRAGDLHIHTASSQSED